MERVFLRPSEKKNGRLRVKNWTDRDKKSTVGLSSRRATKSFNIKLDSFLKNSLQGFKVSFVGCSHGFTEKFSNSPSCSGCRRGVVVSGVRRMNEVNARRARLLPGWVTVFGRVYHLGM